ncbi:hypothetical protein BH23BAC1_BH23BAC1_06510 [soil metagenome]
MDTLYENRQGIKHQRIAAALGQPLKFYKKKEK